jgi:hypothetical protein
MHNPTAYEIIDFHARTLLLQAIIYPYMVPAARNDTISRGRFRPRTVEGIVDGAGAAPFALL